MNRPSLVLIPQHFGALLFDRRSSRYLPFDRPAAAVLHALIERPVGAVLAASAPEDREALRGFAGDLSRRGYLRLDGRLAAARIDRTPPEHHLLGPLAVHLEVIGACNLTATAPGLQDVAKARGAAIPAPSRLHRLQ